MNWAITVLIFVTLQRFVEFILDRVNTAWLLHKGAREFGGAHYPALIFVHAMWLVNMWAIALVLQPQLDVVFLLMFALVQVARYWVLASLGRFWTTRIIVLPGAKPIESGPYRYCRHPNYLVVAAELWLLPMAFGMPLMALAWLIGYGCVMFIRIPAENAALAWARWVARGQEVARNG